MNFSIIGLAQVVGLIKYAERCFVHPDMPWMDILTPVAFVIALDLLRHFVAGVIKGFNAKKVANNVDTTNPPEAARIRTTGIRL